MPNDLVWPTVSIVTPSYNQARFIEDTLLSVRGQKYPNLEHIVVDGGSTDNTSDILRRYESTYNLQWTSEPDEGQSDAINKGFQRAQGEIIGWLNSDDTYMPGAIITAVRHLVENPHLGWVCGDGYWIDEHSRVLSIKYSGPYSFEDLVCRGMYLTQPAIFFRRHVIDEIGFLDREIHTTMDYDFFLRMGLEFDADYIPAILATRRLHSEAKTTSRSVEFCKDALASLDKLFLAPDLPMDIARLKGEAYAQRYLICGYQAFSANDFSKARQMLWKSIKLRPRPWHRDTWIMLLLMIESFLGVKWIAPGYFRRKSDREFQAQYGDVFVNWA